MRKVLRDYFLIIVGSSIMAFGTSVFLLPNKLSTGGFTGLATIFYYYFKISMGTSIIIMNLPLFIISYFKIGKEFLIKTIFATAFYSKMIDLMSKIEPFTSDRFLSSIYGGALVGIGLGIIFKAKASTGGSDLLVNILKRTTIKFNTSNLLMIIDIFIIIINLLFFREIEIGLYSSIAILMSGKLIDIVFEGINFSKTLYIISEKAEEISEKLIKEMDVGATALYGKGLYKKNTKPVILCVCKRRNLIAIREFVLGIDSSAFIIITDAREVYGLRI